MPTDQNAGRRRLTRQVRVLTLALDEWGYPLLAEGPVPTHLLLRARAAAAACPVLALKLGGHRGR